MESQQPVFTGFWINWTGGKILGSTLTLSAGNGRYLVALLALFVRVAGANCWGIICYVVFRLRSKATGHDGLFYQHQTILRNVSSDSSAIWQLLQSGYHWRGRTPKPALRSLQFVALATFHLALFALAGTFSSHVTSAGSEVLLAPEGCGVWSFQVPTTNVLQAYGSLIFARENLAQAFRLAPACYTGTQAISSEECPLPGRNLPSWSLSLNGTCPFADPLCAGNLTVALDSGLIDSLYDLGINSRPEERIQYRQTYTCSPLDITTFVSQANFTGFDNTPTGIDESLSWTSLFLGQNLFYNASATFSYSNETVMPDTVGSSSTGGTDDYVVDVEWFDPQFGYNGNINTFFPISELRTDDESFVNLFILLNGAAYLEPVADPWFNATEPESTGNPTLFGSGQTITALGCSSVYLICNPQITTETQCEHFSMLSLPSLVVDVASDTLKLSPVQQSMLTRILNATMASPMLTIPQMLGSGSLLASADQFGLVSNPLPQNQWILELQNWFSTSMIALQLYSNSYIQHDQQYAAFNKTLPSTDAEWMCSNQIVLRDEYTSFSVLALSCILVTGCLLIVVNLGLSKFVTWIQHKTPCNDHRTWEWIAQGTLQLQRQAYAGHGLGHWEGENDFPVTKPREKFGFLKTSFGRRSESYVESEGGADSIPLERISDVATPHIHIHTKHGHDYNSLSGQDSPAMSVDIGYNSGPATQGFRVPEASQESYFPSPQDSQRHLLPRKPIGD